MNMYAIFNSAMFVGLYTLKASEHFHSSFLELLIILLGFIAGWFWYFSSRGFYRWIISWIKTVNYFENDLNSKVHLYRRFVHTENEKESDIYAYNPFSTQKLTKRFTLAIAIAWSILLSYFLYKKNILNISIPGCCKNNFYVVLTGLVVAFILLTAFCKGNFSCREHLEKSHVHYKE